MKTIYLSDELRCVVALFMHKYNVQEDVLLDMYLGAVVGAAIRSGQSRESFITLAGRAYDQLVEAAQQKGLD